MLVCLISVLHEPYDKRVYQKIARSLVAAGHQVVSIGPAQGEYPDEREGVRFQFIPMPHSKKQRLFAVGRLVRVAGPVKADVYVAPEPESWVAGLIVKLLHGGKVVFDMHEHAPTEFAKFFPNPMQPFMTWLTVRFMRLFARYTDHIILTRESFEPPWEGLRTPRTVIINSSHVQPICDEIPEALQQRFADAPTIIHQGQFGDIRGSYQLLEAMRVLVRDRPNLRCIVLGTYNFGSEDAYRRAIAEAGLENNILMEGVVPYEEVPAYIRVAQVGLILFQPGIMSHTLAMPHKLFDYMREERPVVAPDFSLEVARIVNETQCGVLVDVTNPEAIAAAIARLLDHPDEARSLGENGRRAVETEYNWQAEERRLLDVFRGLEQT